MIDKEVERRCPSSPSFWVRCPFSRKERKGTKWTAEKAKVGTEEEEEVAQERKESIFFPTLSLFLFHTSSSSFSLSEKSIVINTTERGRGEKSPQRNLRFQVEEFGFLRICADKGRWTEREKKDGS